jgi:FkbM family methyltransferase
MLFHKLITGFRFYKTFGFEGIKFLLKRKLSRLISIDIKFKYKIWLRGNTSDIDTFVQVIYEQSYNISLEFEPFMIIDLGSNIGLTTLYFKNRFPQAKVLALEPETENFKLLKKNTQFYSDIDCFNLAIWNKSTYLSVENIGLDNWGFIVSETDTDTNNCVTSITMSELINKNNIKCIDILKIDIEGSEKELFESPCDDWLKITKVIIIELHDRIKFGASEAFFNALSNYSCSFVSKGESIVCYLNHDNI